MIVAKGSLLTSKNLNRLTDSLYWIGLSLDSGNELVNSKLGRGNGHHCEIIRRAAKWAHELGLKVKLNTVVNAYNLNEDFSSILEEIKPDRWKVLQILPVIGENDRFFSRLRITANQFNHES